MQYLVISCYLTNFIFKIAIVFLAIYTQNTIPVVHQRKVDNDNVINGRVGARKS